MHGALSFLVTRGYLSRAEVTQVAQERVLAALLPIAWQTATATTAPGRATCPRNR